MDAILDDGRFDNLRVTPRSLDALSNGPPICGDLAVELGQSGPQFTQVTNIVNNVMQSRIAEILKGMNILIDMCKLG